MKVVALFLWQSKRECAINGSRRKSCGIVLEDRRLTI